MKIAYQFPIISIVLLLVFTGCQSNVKLQKSDIEKNYIFFIHNKFLEENPDGTFSDKYNVRVDYKGILSTFKKDGFVVFSKIIKDKKTSFQI